MNSVNGHRYIGSATNFRQRFKEHRSSLQRDKHHSRYLQGAFCKYGVDAFEMMPILICAPADLLFFEQLCIDGLKPEYNVSPTARNTLGAKHSEETKEKIRAKAIGRKWSEESKAKVSAALKGRKISESERLQRIGNKRAAGHKHTDEWKAENSRRNTGVPRPKSPEHRAKIAASLRGRKATPEHRANQAASQLGKKRGPYKSASGRENAACI